MVSRNGGVSRFLCFFLWGLRAAGVGRGGQEAPCKHLDLGWVRAGVGQSQGSRLEKWVPLQTQASGDSACASLPPQNKTTVKKPEQMGRGITAILGTSDRGGLQTEACGHPSPEFEAEGGDRKAENKEDRGEKRPGDRQGAWSSWPHLPQGLGEQSQRWPILPGPLPLRRGHSPSGCS